VFALQDPVINRTAFSVAGLRLVISSDLADGGVLQPQSTTGPFESILQIQRSNAPSIFPSPHDHGAQVSTTAYQIYKIEAL
jgi:hypothetical protein